MSKQEYVKILNANSYSELEEYINEHLEYSAATVKNIKYQCVDKIFYAFIHQIEDKAEVFKPLNNLLDIANALKVDLHIDKWRLNQFKQMLSGKFSNIVDEELGLMPGLITDEVVLEPCKNLQQFVTLNNSKKDK